VLMALVLSGCSGGSSAAPATLPPVPVPTTSSASPAATPVSTPSGMDAATPQGASAFTKYWFELLNGAYQSADATEVIASSDPACETCGNFIQVVSGLAERHERFTGPVFHVISAEAPPIVNGRTAVDVFYDVPRRTRVSSTGSVIKASEPSPATEITVTLRRANDGWLVEKVATA
jgi:Family of unknown function (DUF6318)